MTDDEADGLKLVKWVLLWIAIISIGIFVGYSVNPDNKALADIFELVKIGALPLVILIVLLCFQSQNR